LTEEAKPIKNAKNNQDNMWPITDYSGCNVLPYVKVKKKF
jgi:hypothetical protein